MDANSIVQTYYNKHLFAFLPNICNSACDFCYVEPIIGKSAKLSREFLNNFKTLAKQAKELGFKTIRITGGEPLIFNNFSSIISILKESELDYTILSNGQNIHNYINEFQQHLPKKITISFHSKKMYYEIFKNDIDFNILFKSLRQLKEKKVEIATTTLFLDENHKEITELLNLFEEQELDSAKLIYPNNYLSKNDLKGKFINTKFNSNYIDIRVTDFKQKSCLLKSRGFISIIVEDLSVYNCCTNVGESENQTITTEVFDLKEIIVKQYLDNKNIKDIPCKTNLLSCPIALRKITKGNNVYKK
jgi:MoaA/NifB/PqqE/SkfB family radical SAM enzyme